MQEVDLQKEVYRLQNKLSEAVSLLSGAHDYMDNTHGYDTDLYAEISEYFDGDSNE